MYNKIAKFYDKMGWGKFSQDMWSRLKMYFEQIDFQPKTHLDIACGTGILCINAQAAGIKSEGIDLSSEMIKYACKNAKNENFHIQFTCCDMKSFNLGKKYDFITCTFDAINHLHLKEEWESTFSCVKKHLNDGGFFVFDANTVKALKEAWDRFYMQKDTNGNYFIQKATFFEDEDKASTKITVFCKQENGLFDSFEEAFTEKAFYSKEIIEMLHKVGFKEVIIADKEFNKIDNPDEKHRNYFICK